MKKIRKKTFNQELIERLVNPNTLEWPREQKILKKLMELYPDKKIWINVDRKVNSLAHFLTSEGREYLIKIKNNIDFEIKENILPKLSSEKLGNDLDIKKLLTIKEFINKYKKDGTYN